MLKRVQEAKTRIDNLIKTIWLFLELVQNTMVVVVKAIVFFGAKIW